MLGKGSILKSAECSEDSSRSDLGISEKKLLCNSNDSSYFQVPDCNNVYKQ